MWLHTQHVGIELEQLRFVANYLTKLLPKKRRERFKEEALQLKRGLTAHVEFITEKEY